MLKPLLVNRTLKPRSMKGVDFNKLPVQWMANIFRLYFFFTKLKDMEPISFFYVLHVFCTVSVTWAVDERIYVKTELSVVFTDG